MIEAVGLTKSYGSKTAVYNLSFSVQPGKVTGFLGPNGAGKSTTMRMILGLDQPTAGAVTIGGYTYRQLPNAPRQVGALLDANAKHGGRSARAHLLSLAQLSGIPARRVDEVLGVVGLQDVAKRRSKGFSLGMGQRLGIAAALLGDPHVLLFDEPVNGLDPEGILWVRNLMRRLAAEGRTIFVSSHLMSEMAQTADHLIVIGRGQLMADLPVADFIRQNSTGFARVRTAEDTAEPREKLVHALAEAGGQVLQEQDGALKVVGLGLPHISDLAHEAGARLWELSPHTASLEEAYMRMTQGAVDFRSTADQRSGLTQQAPAAAWQPQQAAPPVPQQVPAGATMALGVPAQQPPPGATMALGVPAQQPPPGATMALGVPAQQPAAPPQQQPPGTMTLGTPVQPPATPPQQQPPGTMTLGTPVQPPAAQPAAQQQPPQPPQPPQPQPSAPSSSEDAR
ncbi:ATP-binding cassette domain-containing protein [Streptomyces sp. MP131-18]|uniref:ABC transporter ATP-binding protein n=1 Tax=Streptomyces sp. MP131-18 TaxID=1857892 RepID=UPI00097BAD79|nr:ATP-binding cassette domain-containing protein [Streptomyces sp. MP131-18]ONK11143.1 putative ABC transporter ATP-binding protein YxlF [Streptomyces sp. MP131-18]